MGRWGLPLGERRGADLQAVRDDVCPSWLVCNVKQGWG